MSIPIQRLPPPLAARPPPRPPSPPTPAVVIAEALEVARHYCLTRKRLQAPMAPVPRLSRPDEVVLTQPMPEKERPA